MHNSQWIVQIGGAERGVRKQRRLRKVIKTIPGAVLDRLRAGLSAREIIRGRASFWVTSNGP